jgi:hypothetical protein
MCMYVYIYIYYFRNLIACLVTVASSIKHIVLNAHILVYIISS